MNMLSLYRGLIVCSLFLVLGLAANALPPDLSTMFTYQGHLLNGTVAANGAYDLEFKLFDSGAGGGQVGTTQDRTVTVANGLFTVNLDFGDVFANAPLWLEVSARPAGVGGYTAFARQQLLPTPFAGNADKVDNLHGSQFMRSDTDTGTTGSVTVAGATTLNGATTINNTLAVSGASTLNSLGVTLDTTIGGALTVTGDTALSTLGASGLATLESLTVTHAAAVGGTLGVTGNTTLSGTLSAGNTTVGTLGAGNTAITGTLGTSGLATLNSLTVQNDSTLTGALTVGGATSLAGLTAGNTAVTGTLTITGATILNGGLTVPTGQTTTLDILNVGNTAITGAMSTTGAATLNSLGVTNNAAVGGTLSAGNTTVGTLAAGNTAITGTLGASGLATLNSLTVTNNTAVGGTLGVTGNTSLTTLGTSGLATLDSLGVTNNATVGGAFGVTGNLAVNANKLTVAAATGNTAIAGTLGVVGNATLGSDTVSGKLIIKNGPGVGTELTSSGTGDLMVNGAVLGTLTTGTTYINGPLSVNGANATTLGGTLDVAGDVAVNTNKFTIAAGTGNTVIAGTLGVTGNTALSTLGTSGLATLNSLAVTNNATIGGTLGVTGATTLTTATASGLITANGGVKYPDGKTQTKALTTGAIVDADVADTAAIQVAKLGQSGATNGQILQWNGTTWAPSGALATEVTTRIQGDADTLAASKTYTDASVSAEATARDTAIGAATTTEVTNRNTAIGAAITTEVTNRNTAIAGEATARDTAIGAAITTEVANRNTAITTAVAGEATARDTAIGVAVAPKANATDVYTKGQVDTAIAGEATARDTAIGTAITTEAGNRDTAIGAAIATEVTNRNTAIAGEATARDTAIGAAIATEVTNRNTAIAGEATARDTAIGVAVAPKANTADVYTKGQVDTALAGKADTTHSHAAGDITSGTFGIARGGTGATSFTANKFLIYDGATLTSTTYDNSSFATTSHTHAVSDLTQGVATDGQVLTWSDAATSWVPVTPGVSDSRFKANIQPLTGALDIVKKLRGVSYDWRRDAFPKRYFTGTHQIGFIAQEVETVLPELVSKDAQGYRSLQYEKFAPVLTEAIKEQQQTIEKLQADNAELNQRLQSLTNAVTELQTRK